MIVLDGSQYTVSLYSETIDVSVIAKKHGGGGHKGAAGFVCPKLPFHSHKKLGEEE
jgi:nanoRNase/pAp phosphatase (c-di-AMP/oligoRNAs hydrolase)